MGSRTYKIVWTKAAYEDYEHVLEYLLRFWSQKVALDFIDKIEHKQDLLSIEPFLGRASEKDNTIRSVLITVHNRLYYYVEEDRIHSFKDVRH